MSGVVIRCPNCGTTQTALGECEACHEADARHFCPNHTPGRWLDGPSCSVCGARVGAGPAGERPEPPPRRPARPRPTSPRLGEALPPPSARPTVPSDDPSRDPEFVWRGPVRTPGRGVLEELGGRRGGLPFDPASIAPIAFKVFSLFGCLRRLVVLVIVLVVLAMLAFFGLFGVGGLLYGAEPGGARYLGFSYTARPPT